MLTIDTLKADGFVLAGNKSDNGESHTAYILTPKGKGKYLEERRNNVEFRLTQLFALLGTVIGVIALVK